MKICDADAAETSLTDIGSGGQLADVNCDLAGWNADVIRKIVAKQKLRGASVGDFVCHGTQLAASIPGKILCAVTDCKSPYKIAGATHEHGSAIGIGKGETRSER